MMWTETISPATSQVKHQDDCWKSYGNLGWFQENSNNKNGFFWPTAHVARCPQQPKVRGNAASLIACTTKYFARKLILLKQNVRTIVKGQILSISFANALPSLVVPYGTLETGNISIKWLYEHLQNLSYYHLHLYINKILFFPNPHFPKKPSSALPQAIQERDQKNQKTL